MHHELVCKLDRNYYCTYRCTNNNAFHYKPLTMILMIWFISKISIRDFIMFFNWYNRKLCHMSSVYMIHFSLCHSTGDYITVVIVIFHRHIFKCESVFSTILSNFRYRFTQPCEPMRERESKRDSEKCLFMQLPFNSIISALWKSFNILMNTAIDPNSNRLPFGSCLRII